MWKEWLGEARIKKLAKADWIKKVYHSIVNQLYSNIKLKLKKKNKQRYSSGRDVQRDK